MRDNWKFIFVNIEEGGIRYEGEWKFDIKDGYGVQKWPGVGVFEGVWKDGKQTEGTITWEDKSYYKGEFFGDFLQGQGTLITSDEIIRGEWKKSKLNGKGERILLHDGSRYVGKWVQGKLSGNGEYTSPTETYKGHFSNNLEHGTGK